MHLDAAEPLLGVAKGSLLPDQPISPWLKILEQALGHGAGLSNSAWDLGSPCAACSLSGRAKREEKNQLA